MTTLSDILRGRQTILWLTNKSGSGVVEGDVVVIDITTTSAFTTTTAEGETTAVIGVALETIADNADGRICITGYIPKINLTSSASLGNFVRTSTTAKNAIPVTSIQDGVFGQVLGTGTSPAAVITGMPQKSSGGGDSTYTSDYASRPSAGNDGDLFLPSDGFTIERDTSAAWVPWGPLFPLTVPPTTGWSWVNQGSSTINVAKGGIYMQQPPGAGNNVSLYMRSIPTAPYTITAALLPLLYDINYTGAGIALRDSASSKIIVFRLTYTDSLMQVQRYSDASTYVSTSISVNTQLGRHVLWLRVENDSTDLKFSISADGQNWIEILSESNTAYLASADEIGFFAYANNATYPAGATLISWDVA